MSDGTLITQMLQIYAGFICKIATKKLVAIFCLRGLGLILQE
jgi:hypothetical protein